MQSWVLIGREWNVTHTSTTYVSGLYTYQLFCSNSYKEMTICFWIYTSPIKTRPEHAPDFVLSQQNKISPEHAPDFVLSQQNKIGSVFRAGFNQTEFIHGILPWCF